MQKLTLVLSSQIEPHLKGELKITGGINRQSFALNKSFTINEIKLGGQAIDYSVEKSTSNYNWITIACNKSDLANNLAISYSGSLDGTTGGYPYVKEKTADNFFLLRQETFYYPIFYPPGSEDYYNSFIYPSEHDAMEVQIKIDDGRSIVSNMQLTSKACYLGYNPSFAIAPFSVTRTKYGNIYYLDCQIDTGQIVNVIARTNAYLKKYKETEVEDYNIVVIPKGYGSFVLPNIMFVTEDAVSSYWQLIHELIHTNWNPNVEIACQRVRFFDEGLTQYLTAKTCDYLGLQELSESRRELEKAYLDLIRSGSYASKPMKDYGRYGLGDLTYYFGPLFLFALEDRVGSQEMESVLKKMLELYSHPSKEKIDFLSFKNLFQDDVDDIFQDYYETENHSRKLFENNFTSRNDDKGE